jgi:hypothetical protein
MTTCPQCNGFGYIGDLFGKISCDCPLCNKTGMVSSKYILWKMYGRTLKYYRLDWLHLGLREAARKFKIDASNLSKMERGVIKPSKYWVKQTEGGGTVEQRKEENHG